MKTLIVSLTLKSKSKRNTKQKKNYSPLANTLDLPSFAGVLKTKRCCGHENAANAAESTDIVGIYQNSLSRTKDIV